MLLYIVYHMLLYIVYHMLLYIVYHMLLYIVYHMLLYIVYHMLLYIVYHMLLYIVYHMLFEYKIVASLGREVCPGFRVTLKQTCSIHGILCVSACVGADIGCSEEEG